MHVQYNLTGNATITDRVEVGLPEGEPLLVAHEPLKEKKTETRAGNCGTCSHLAEVVMRVGGKLRAL